MPQHAQQVAQHLGYPSALFGFTPDQEAYWHEPGLPLLTLQESSSPPVLRNGLTGLWVPCDFITESMAPRFPKGCTVNVAPVFSRANLVVGRVYLYAYQDEATGQLAYQVGRLEKVGGNCLWARADNRPEVRLVWCLREDEREAVWDVYEVTHYLHYPAL